MMYMDVAELKILCGEKRVDELIRKGRLPLARVQEELVVMDNIHELETELTGGKEDIP